MTTKQPSRRKSTTPRLDEAAESIQLKLIDGGRRTHRAWQLDARTRRIGRERVAEAREILRRAQPPEPIARHHRKAG